MQIWWAEETSFKKLKILLTPNVCAHAQINGWQKKKMHWSKRCRRVSGLSPVSPELLYSVLYSQRPALHSESANYKRNKTTWLFFHILIIISKKQLTKTQKCKMTLYLKAFQQLLHKHKPFSQHDSFTWSVLTGRRVSPLPPSSWRCRLHYLQSSFESKRNRERDEDKRSQRAECLCEAGTVSCLARGPELLSLFLDGLLLGLFLFLGLLCRLSRRLLFFLPHHPRCLLLGLSRLHRNTNTHHRLTTCRHKLHCSKNHERDDLENRVCWEQTRIILMEVEKYCSCN